jgi:ankyrin repeat protein
MSDLSHQRAFRLIYEPSRTEAEEAALQSHLRTCTECRRDAQMAGLFSDHLILKSLPTRPSAQFTAVYLESAARRSRRSQIMKPIYTVGGAIALALIVLASWFIVRGNPQTTTLDSAPMETVISVTPGTLVTPQVEALPAPLDENLVAAVKAGDDADVERLLEAGADPDVVDSNENAMLAVAAMTGRLEIAQLLLDAGADVNGTRNYDNQTASALYSAVSFQHNDIAELLINYGADVNWLWDDEREFFGTPLHAAAWNNDVEMVRQLIENGADPNLRSRWRRGTTPLSKCLVNDSVEAAQVLLDNGAEVDLATDLGVTPLMHGINLMEPSGGLVAGVALLLEAGADPDLQDKIGDTALHYAAREHKSEAVDLLIEYGADINITNKAGQTPLDVATSEEIKEMLRRAGASE